MEDVAVVYMGSAVFKIFRLTFIALFSVHLFACIFFWVKLETANHPEDVTEFYTSRNASDKVSHKLKNISQKFVLQNKPAIRVRLLQFL
jgi:hypothetical protein